MAAPTHLRFTRFLPGLLAGLFLLAACGTAPTPGTACAGTTCCERAGAMAEYPPTGRRFDRALLAAPDPSPAPPTPTRAWSDATGWPGGALPQEGDAVVIGTGEVVLLDVSPPRLDSLEVAGALVFDRRDLELRADAILLCGGLYIGSQDEPFRQRAVITLSGGRPAAPDDGHLGANHLALLGGTLELYGAPEGTAWTRLAETAAAGATSVVVDDAAGWRVGDRLAIASTDFYADTGPSGARRDAQVEERTVTAVTGARLTLDRPLDFLHFGVAQTFGDPGGATLESRAEVVRLSRNVTVQGPASAADPGSPDYQFGGQIMAMGASRVRLDSVELARMGQAGLLLRYPVHWHMMGDAGAGSFVRNSTLHDLYNRCITIHGTAGVLLDGNAAYGTQGHCYFLEDGSETGNLLRGNLALQVRRPSEANAILPTDRSHMGPAAFWVTNPANYLVGNVAASSEGSGFWYALPEHPTGPSYDRLAGATTWPRRTPLGAFDGNLAHSNRQDGLHVDRGPAKVTLAAETTSYTPRVDPADRSSAPVTAYFDSFVAYKHRSAGAWFRGDNTVLRGALLVDNAIGVTFASSSSGLTGSVVVGESANLGSPRSWEPTGLDGRALPRYWDKQFAVRGFEFYDGPVYVTDTYFERFEPNALREAAAISVLDYTSWSMSPLSYASGLEFAPATNRVRLETRAMEAYDPRAEDSGEDGYRSAVFRDEDGSVTGTAGSYVTVVNPLLAAPTCQYRADWNANVCDGHYVSLTLRDDGEPAQGFAPLSLRRAGDSATHPLYGSPNGGPSVPNVHYRSIVRAGHEYVYEHARGTPSDFSIDLRELLPGDRLVVSLPYAGVDLPFIYRDYWIDDRGRVPAAPTLAILRGGTDAAYYLDAAAGRLYLLLAQQSDRDWARLTVCQSRLC